MWRPCARQWASRSPGAIIRAGSNPPGPTYQESVIRALFRPVPPGLISSGLYMKNDLQMVTGVAVVPGDEIVRFGDTYTVLDQPFVRRLSDRVVAYETKVRKV